MEYNLETDSVIFNIDFEEMDLNILTMRKRHITETLTQEVYKKVFEKYDDRFVHEILVGPALASELSDEILNEIFSTFAEEYLEEKKRNLFYYIHFADSEKLITVKEIFDNFEKRLNDENKLYIMLH